MRNNGGEAAYLNYDLWYCLFTNKYRGAIELTPYTGISTLAIDGPAGDQDIAPTILEQVFEEVGNEL